MADIFEAFATDEKLEAEGRWVDFTEDTSFKIARAPNKAYSRLLSKLYGKSKMILESKGDAAEAKSDTIMIEVLAKTVLLDWRGTVKLKGEILKYSEENAKKLLAIKDFRRYISDQAADFDSFKVANEVEEKKSLPTT